jgi:hypothetical protein
VYIYTNNYTNKVTKRITPVDNLKAQKMPLFMGLCPLASEPPPQQ